MTDQRCEATSIRQNVEQCIGDWVESPDEDVEAGFRKIVEWAERQ